MARQIGPTLLLGTVDNLTGYIQEGKPYVRMKSSLTRKQWKTSPAFANTRRAARDFGAASRIAADLWNRLPPIMRRIAGPAAYNTLTGAIRTHIPSAPVIPAVEIARALDGLHLNPFAPVPDESPFHITQTANTLQITFPGLPNLLSLLDPTQTYTLRLHATAIALIDYALDSRTQTFNLPHNPAVLITPLDLFSNTTLSELILHLPPCGQFDAKSHYALFLALEIRLNQGCKRILLSTSAMCMQVSIFTSINFEMIECRPKPKQMPTHVFKVSQRIVSRQLACNSNPMEFGLVQDG